MIRNIILIVTAAFIMSGCASGGAIGEKVLAQAVVAGKARLVLYRTNPLGALVQPDYLINGQPVGASQPSGFVTCQLRPGKHNISVANASLNMNLGGGTDKIDVQLTPGTTTYIKASPSIGLTVGVITLERVPTSQGKSDTASLSQISASCRA